MRLKTIRIAGERTTAARIDRRRTVPLPFSDVGAIISAGPGWQVVIGGETSRVSVAEALHHVAGYTTVNSIAVPGRAALVAIGPQLVTPDELPLGARGLTLTAFHNGRLRQKANTSDLLFDVATLIAHASATTTLMPGDLITTGTPADTATDPLHDGSELIVAIKGIGDLHTTITCQPDR